MGSINYSQAIRPDKAYLKKIIESSLLADWAIRIEYQGDESSSNNWQLWGKAFFAIKSAEAVLTALMDCYAKHPASSIRLNAEKFRPQSRVLYTVYNPEYLPAETKTNTQTSIKQFSNEQVPLRIGLNN